jgi:antitoxin MazE
MIGYIQSRDARKESLMDASIQKWGNSSAIRLPKPILKTADITDNDIVQITAKRNEIIIRKDPLEKYTLEGRLRAAGWKSKRYSFEEMISGDVGAERWMDGEDEI